MTGKSSHLNSHRATQAPENICLYPQRQSQWLIQIGNEINFYTFQLKCVLQLNENVSPAKDQNSLTSLGEQNSLTLQENNNLKFLLAQKIYQSAGAKQTISLHFFFFF